MKDQIENNFKYHPPKPNQIPRYEMIRNLARDFALTVNSMTPESREKSLGMTKLEEAVMWFNAAIARNEKE